MEEDDYLYEEEDYEINYEPDESDLLPQESFSIVKLDDLNNLREKIIKEFIEKTYMERDDSIIALINYKWNLDKINDDWYNDVEGNRKKFGIDVDENNSKELEKENIEKNSNYCLICFSEFEKDPKNPNNFLKFSLKCNHNFCEECFKEYLIDKLDDYYCCLYSTCPQKGCTLKIPESLFYKFLNENPNLKKKFDKIVLRNFTENNVDIKWCPNPTDCGRCVRTDSHFNREITCDCNYVYCFSCLREGHR